MSFTQLDIFNVIPYDHKFSSSIDFLVSACTLHRLKSSGENYVNKARMINFVTDDALTPMITEDDRKLAMEIRDYYSKKITMWQLQGKSLSKFRVSLANFIASTTIDKDTNSETPGLAYRLPEFYLYDTTLDKLKEECFSKINDDDNDLPAASPVSLMPVTVLYRNTRSQKPYNVYLFKLQDSGKPVWFELYRDNPIRMVWDILFAQNLPMKVKARLAKVNINDFCFYKLDKIESMDNIMVNN
jgi:hypothetical protein